jgi:hypothetical protein
VKILDPNLAKENMKWNLLVFGEVLDQNFAK